MTTRQREDLVTALQIIQGEGKKMIDKGEVLTDEQLFSFLLSDACSLLDWGMDKAMELEKLKVEVERLKEIANEFY